MNLFSAIKILILAFISLSIIDVNCAQAQVDPTAGQLIKQYDDLDQAIVNLHYLRGDPEQGDLNLASSHALSPKEKAEIKLNLAQLRREINLALALKPLSNNANAEQNTWYGRIKQALGDLQDPNAFPIFQELNAYLDQCTSQTYGPILDIRINPSDKKTIRTERAAKLRQLFLQDIDTPIRTDLQNTLLWMAAARGCAELTTILLLLGANPNKRIPNNAAIVDDRNKSVIDKVNEINRTIDLEPILTLFKDYGYDVSAQQQQQAPIK